MLATSNRLHHGARLGFQDPLFGFYDRSLMRRVQVSNGYSVGQQVVTNNLGKRMLGTIVAIGEHAKHLNGGPFTAFAVQCEDGILYLHEESEIEKRPFKLQKRK
jgi:hypothetical protein